MRFYVLDMGALRIADAADLLPLSHAAGITDVPIPAYLVVTNEGRHMLIDTGMPARFAGPPETAAKRSPFGPATVPMLQDCQTIQSQLAAIGLRPQDIDDVICTHLDWDHSGGNRLFTSATFWLQAEHFLAATSMSRDRYDEGDWRPAGMRCHLVSGREVVSPGVELIPTPGHAQGHQSVLVILSRRPMLICGDAIASREKLAAGHWADQEDPNAAAASAEALGKEARIRGARLLFGHDPGQARRLHHAPRFYA